MKKPTEREVLKVVFHLLGVLANFIIQGKIRSQEMWNSGIKWDEKITDDLNIK